MVAPAFRRVPKTPVYARFWRKQFAIQGTRKMQNSLDSFKSKKTFTPRVRNIEDDFEDEGEETHEPTQTSPTKKPFLKIIDGGKE